MERIAPGESPFRTPAGIDSDFSQLHGSDEYARYFNLLARAWRILMKCYRLGESEDTYEAHRVEEYLERLLSTVRALRMKYTHSPAHRRMLWVDLSESGFPNAQEIAALATALLHRSERLRELPTAALLRQLMLDHMFRSLTEPEDLLWQMAERTFLEMLDESGLFLPFVTAAADLDSPTFTVNDGQRHYRCSWGCYDFRTNRPYLHVMTFDQDMDEEPLEHGPNHRALLEVLEAEGTRTPDVAILGMAIDRALDPIHPKIVKRICLGPLYAGMLLDPSPPEEDLGDKHRVLKKLLDTCGQEDDFILFVTDEIAISKRQEVSRTIFSPQGKVREIFLIPETDPECYRRRASVVHRQAIMPHAVAQHLDEDVRRQVPELRGARLLTYDLRGEVHGL